MDNAKEKAPWSNLPVMYVTTFDDLGTAAPPQPVAEVQAKRGSLVQPARPSRRSKTPKGRANPLTTPAVVEEVEEPSLGESIGYAVGGLLFGLGLGLTFWSFQSWRSDNDSEMLVRRAEVGVTKSCVADRPHVGVSLSGQPVRS
jgi:hypothetical protein